MSSEEDPKTVPTLLEHFNDVWTKVTSNKLALKDILTKEPFKDIESWWGEQSESI